MFGSDGGASDEEPIRQSTAHVFKSYAKHRLQQVRADVDLLIADQLQRVCRDLVGLHEELYSGRPARAAFDCRRVEAKRVCLDELEDLDSEQDGAFPVTLARSKECRSSSGFSGGSRGNSPCGSPRANSRMRSNAPSEGEVCFSPSEEIISAGEESRMSWRLEADGDSPKAGTSNMTSPLATDFGVFDLHQLWKDDDQISASKRAQSKPEVTPVRRKLQRRGSLEYKSGAEVTSRGAWSCLVMRPSSPQCLLWDVCCFLAIIHDTVMIPLVSAFPINGRDPAIRSFELVSSVVWFSDVPLTFLRGFLDTRKGIVELRLNQIAAHYARGWMLADVSLCLIDITAYAMYDFDLSSLTLLRLIRNLRIFRIIKMSSRLAVLKEMLMNLDRGMDFIERNGTSVETAVVVVKQLGVIALLCHFTGCAWYAIGASMKPGVSTWVTAHSEFREATVQEDAPWEYMYITAVHWSLTQFTPAAMDVVAVTSLERVFSVVVTLAGLIVFSFFIGTINQALAKLRYATAQEIQQNQLVRRYVNENGISVGLATEILTFIKRRGVGKAQSKLISGDIKILKVLPRNLRDTLMEEVSMPVLLSHPLLNYLSHTGYDALARLCHKAMKEGTVVHGEDVFQPHSTPDRLIFLMSGRLKYTMHEFETEDVYEGWRIGEPALWLKWEYRGRLNCEDQSAYYLALDAPFFRKLMSRSALCEMVMMYARLFLQLMMDTYEHEDEASDLFGNEPGELDELVKTVKGVQDGAAKFGSLGLQRGPDVEDCFDAWKEEWVRNRKSKARKTPLGWFLSFFKKKEKPAHKASRKKSKERPHPTSTRSSSSIFVEESHARAEESHDRAEESHDRAEESPPMDSTLTAKSDRTSGLTAPDTAKGGFAGEARNDEDVERATTARNP